MGQNRDSLTKERLLDHLRGTLNHLYDADRLRKSPLADLFGVADRIDTPTRLQKVLIDAVEALKPAPDELSESPNWRNYNLLFYRYVQQFSQQEVADQLGMSVRHLRRAQNAALDTLVCHISRRYDLDTCHSPDQDTNPVDDDARGQMPVAEDLSWLRSAPPSAPIDLEATIGAVLNLARPLAESSKVSLSMQRSNGLPGPAVHPIALRQMLLNLVSMGIAQAPGGQVTISTQPCGSEVQVRVRTAGVFQHPATALEPMASGLKTAEWLANMCGGRLTIQEDTSAFSTILQLPATEQLPVLVIDDNADSLQLFQRYATGTRYRIIGESNPEQGLRLVATLKPQIIVLDVMMPEMDGWELLQRLRQIPFFTHTPIIVCTILAQEALALSLGASAFLSKPVAPQEFLAALDCQARRLPRGSR
ncbi:MAG: response regulator [Anaerolineae bacterium]